jgi:hypothetical protein
MSKSPQELSPAEKHLRASIAGLTSWANTSDRSARGRHAQEGLFQKFLLAVDPDQQLDVVTRTKNATSLYRAHYQRMALRSAIVRRERREAREREAAELKSKRANNNRGGGAVG